MFIYCLVNKGYEKLLKEEVSFRYPQLRISFSRLGFVTFKSQTHISNIDLIYSRVTGTFIGKYTKDDLDKFISENEKNSLIHNYDLNSDTADGQTAKTGDKITDIIKVNDNEFWVGERVVTDYTWRCSAGLPVIVLPEESPSRAYLKLEDMFLWSGYKYKPGLTAIELGSAPGGVSYALLKRGFKVVGVDSGDMDDICLNNPGFKFLKMSVRDIRKKFIGPDVDILFCDLNLKPVESIPQIRYLSHIYPSIKRVFYTLKVGEGIPIETILAYIDQFRAMGYKIYATHLPANRMEICVAGFRE